MSDAIESAANSSPLFNAEAFRAKLAGLMHDAPAENEAEELRDSAAELCRLLARHFNRDQLQVETLWDRIASGITAACEQVDDGDMDRLMSLCLAHVKADYTAAASDDAVRDFVVALGERPKEYRMQFVQYLKSHLYAALVHGRSRWNQRKGAKK